MTVVRIQIRRDTAADWTSINPTLRAGELGYETDTSNLKIGDGVTAWTSLAYFTGSSGATWGTITGTLSSQTDLQSALDLKAAISSLATVATSGAYVDLTGAPTISAYGLTLIDDADAVTARTTLGLGTAATQASSAFAAASHTHSMLQITSELPVTINYTPGANLNEYLANIDTAFGSYVLSSAISAFGGTLIDDADAATARSTLGLGSAATSNTGDFAAASHNHAATDITSGTLDAARLPAVATQIGELRCTIDGGGAVVVASTAETLIERACTLTVASLYADQSGSITCTVKRDRSATVTTLGTVTLTAAQSVRVTDLSGWTATDLAAGDILIVEWSAPTTVERVVLTLGRTVA